MMRFDATNAGSISTYLTDWDAWKKHYARQLEHPADFERIFVDKVLSQLHNVEPSDVIPQYHFKDSRGGNRYIDYVIKNDAKGYSLAIELDGLTKIQKSCDKSLDYDRYDDMMLRQNDLLRLTDIASLLRFTNKQMFNQAAWVVNEINQELQKQAFNTAREHEQRTHQVKMLADYQRQIQELKQANERISSESLAIKRQNAYKDKVLKDMEQNHAKHLESLTKQQETELDNQQAHIANMLAMLQAQMNELKAKIDGQGDGASVAMPEPESEPKQNKPKIPTITQADVNRWNGGEKILNDFVKKPDSAVHGENLISTVKTDVPIKNRKWLLPVGAAVLLLVGWAYVALVNNPFASDTVASQEAVDEGYTTNYTNYPSSSGHRLYDDNTGTSGVIAVDNRKSESEIVKQMANDFETHAEKLPTTSEPSEPVIVDRASAPSSTVTIPSREVRVQTPPTPKYEPRAESMAQTKAETTPKTSNETVTETKRENTAQNSSQNTQSAEQRAARRDRDTGSYERSPSRQSTNQGADGYDSGEQVVRRDRDEGY